MRAWLKVKMTYLSSDEEQPHSSNLPSEQKSIPNPSVPRSSVQHMVSMGFELSIDTGNSYYYAIKFGDEICLSMKNLSNSEKYPLLSHHVNHQLSFQQHFLMGVIESLI